MRPLYPRRERSLEPGETRTPIRGTVLLGGDDQDATDPLVLTVARTFSSPASTRDI
jgi:hypothetical protein